METNTSSKRSVLKPVLYTMIMVVLVAIDQWSKLLVLRNLSFGNILTVIPGALQFRYVENTGAAFSILTGKTVLLSVITGIILIGVLVLLFLEKIPGTLNQVAVVLMAAGGLGNLIDRIFRHFVVDFIEITFTNFAVFNFADCCVTIGAAILILSTILSFVKEEKSSRN